MSWVLHASSAPPKPTAWVPQNENAPGLKGRDSFAATKPLRHIGNRGPSDRLPLLHGPQAVGLGYGITAPSALGGARP